MANMSITGRVIAAMAALPEEVLLRIVVQTVHNSLPALALVSHSFYRCVTPEMYRFVHFMEVRYEDACFPDWLTKVPYMAEEYDPEVPRRDTRVFSLPRFLRTITTSQTLSSLVKGTSFEWNSADLEEDILRAVKTLGPSIAFLHLSPAKYSLGALFTPRVTSLSIDSLELGAHYMEQQWDTENIYPIFCIPTLRQLSITGVREWDCFDGLAVRDRWRTSNVTCLFFSDSVSAGEDLAELLKWPIALQSFRYEAWPYYSRYGDRSSPLSAKAFIEVLYVHRTSLEELHITGKQSNCGDDGSTVKLIRDFNKLTRLGLLREFMVHAKYETEFWDEVLEPELSIHESIPPAIEELQIEMSTEFRWQQYFEATTPEYMMEEVGEVSNWLCDIAYHKSLHYPKLGKVVIWQQDHRCPMPFCHKFDELPSCTKLVSAFKNANIELSWVESRHSPLFSV